MVTRDHGSTAAPVPAAPERILHSIQALRALAAWSVVLHHYCMILAVQAPSWWRQGFIDHGAVGVDVFFVVSGFVMALSASDPALSPRAFIAKRIGRIVPAYWLFTLIVALMIWGLPEIMLKQGVSPEFLIQSLLFLPAENPGNYHNVLPVITVGWTLNLEMAFYLIVGAAMFVRLPQRWLAIVGAIAVLQLLLAPLEIVSVFYTTPLLYEFLLGIAAAHLWKAGALRGPSWVFAGLAVLAIALLIRAPLNSATHLIDCGVPAFLLVCAFVGCERHFQHAGLLKRLGDHSYSVYLIHPTIFYVGWYVYQETKLRHGLLSVACLTAIALIGAASYRFIERPAGRWLTRLLQPRASA